jgi:hypothetical protein
MWNQIENFLLYVNFEEKLVVLCFENKLRNVRIQKMTILENFTSGFKKWDWRAYELFKEEHGCHVAFKKTVCRFWLEENATYLCLYIKSRRNF